MFFSFQLIPLLFSIVFSSEILFPSAEYLIASIETSPCLPLLVSFTLSSDLMLNSPPSFEINLSLASDNGALTTLKQTRHALTPDEPRTLTTELDFSLPESPSTNEAGEFLVPIQIENNQNVFVLLEFETCSSFVTWVQIQLSVSENGENNFITSSRRVYVKDTLKLSSSSLTTSTEDIKTSISIEELTQGSGEESKLELRLPFYDDFASIDYAFYLLSPEFSVSQCQTLDGRECKETLSNILWEVSFQSEELEAIKKEYKEVPVTLSFVLDAVTDNSLSLGIVAYQKETKTLAANYVLRDLMEMKPIGIEVTSLRAGPGFDFLVQNDGLTDRKMLYHQPSNYLKMDTKKYLNKIRIEFEFVSPYFLDPEEFPAEMTFKLFDSAFSLPLGYIETSFSNNSNLIFSIQDDILTISQIEYPSIETIQSTQYIDFFILLEKSAAITSDYFSQMKIYSKDGVKMGESLDPEAEMSSLEIESYPFFYSSSADWTEHDSLVGLAPENPEFQAPLISGEKQTVAFRTTFGANSSLYPDYSSEINSATKITYTFYTPEVFEFSSTTNGFWTYSDGLLDSDFLSLITSPVLTEKDHLSYLSLSIYSSSLKTILPTDETSYQKVVFSPVTISSTDSFGDFSIFDVLVTVQIGSDSLVSFPENVLILSKDSSDLEIKALNFHYGNDDNMKALPVFLWMRINKNLMADSEVRVFYAGIQRMESDSNINGLMLSEGGNLEVSTYFEHQFIGETSVVSMKCKTSSSSEEIAGYFRLASLEGLRISQTVSVETLNRDIPSKMSEIEQKLTELMSGTYPVDVVKLDDQDNRVGSIVSIKLEVKPYPFSDGAMGFYLCGEWALVETTYTIELFSDFSDDDDLATEFFLLPECVNPLKYTENSTEMTCIMCHFTNGEALTNKTTYIINRFQLPRSNGLRWPSNFYGGTFYKSGLASTYTNIGERTSSIMSAGILTVQSLKFGREMNQTALWALADIYITLSNRLESGNSLVINYPSTITVASSVEENDNCFINYRQLCTFVKKTNRFEISVLEDIPADTILVQIGGFRVSSGNQTAIFSLATYSNFTNGLILDSTSDSISVSLESLMETSDLGEDVLTLELIEIDSNLASSQTNFAIQITKPSCVFQPADTLVIDVSGATFLDSSFCIAQSSSHVFVDGIDMGDYFAYPEAQCLLSVEDSQVVIENLSSLNTTKINLMLQDLMIPEVSQIEIMASLVKWKEETIAEGSLNISVGSSSLLCDDFELEVIENIYSEPIKISLFCTIQKLFSFFDKFSIHLNPRYFSYDPETLVVLRSNESSATRTMLYTNYDESDRFQAVILDYVASGTSLKFELLNAQLIVPVSTANAEENLVELTLEPYASNETYFSYRLDKRDVSEAIFTSSSSIKWAFTCTDELSLEDSVTLFINFSLPDSATLKTGDTLEFDAHFLDFFSIYQLGQTPSIDFSGVSLGYEEIQDSASFSCENSALVAAFHVSCVIESGSLSNGVWLMAQWTLLKSEVSVSESQEEEVSLYLDLLEPVLTRYSSKALLSCIGSPLFLWDASGTTTVHPGLFSSLSFDLLTPNVSSGYYFKTADSRLTSLFYKPKTCSENDNSITVASASSLALWVSGLQDFPECSIRIPLKLENTHNSSISILVPPLKLVRFLPEKRFLPFTLSHFAYPNIKDTYPFSLFLIPEKSFDGSLYLSDQPTQEFKNYSGRVDFSILTSGFFKIKLLFTSTLYEDIESRITFEDSALIIYDFLEQEGDLSVFDLWYHSSNETGIFTTTVTFDEFSPFQELNISSKLQKVSTSASTLPVFNLVELTESSIVLRISSTSLYVSYMAVCQKVGKSYSSGDILYSDSEASTIKREVISEEKSDGIVLQILEISNSDNSDSILEVGPEDLLKFIETNNTFENNSTLQISFIQSNPDTRDLYLWFENLVAGSQYLVEIFYTSLDPAFGGEWKLKLFNLVTQDHEGSNFHLSFRLLEDSAYSVQEEPFVCLISHFLDYPNVLSFQGTECSEELYEELFGSSSLVPGQYSSSASVYRRLKEEPIISSANFSETKCKTRVIQAQETDLDDFYMKYETTLDLVIIKRDEAWEEYLGPERVIGILSMASALNEFNAFLRDFGANYSVQNLTIQDIPTWSSPQVSNQPIVTIDRTFLNVANISTDQTGLFEVRVLQNGDYEINSAKAFFNPEPGISSKIVYSLSKQVDAEEEISFTVPNLISSQTYQMFYYARGNNPRSEQMHFSSLVQVSISTEEYVELYSLIFERAGSYPAVSCLVLLGMTLWLL